MSHAKVRPFARMPEPRKRYRSVLPSVTNQGQHGEDEYRRHRNPSVGPNAVAGCAQLDDDSREIRTAEEGFRQGGTYREKLASEFCRTR